MSFGNLQTPIGDLNARRVMNPSYIDLASVEYIVSNTSIAEARRDTAHFGLVNFPAPSGGYHPIRG